MVSWRDIAASAYRAYMASSENKNYMGVTLPPWNYLPASQQTAWEAAVRQAVDVAQGGSYGLDIETKWYGWKSPFFETITKTPTNPVRRKEKP